ncbi:MAG: hypothetical protein R2716_08450 [Microthrixaceae bacterium]
MSGAAGRPVDLEDLPQPVLAALVREYLLCGHLIDRAGMPYVIAAHGRTQMGEIAIDEWMGASPVYTARMQRLLGFEGDDVATVFKGMQFDIGAPHGFLDFRYTVHDEHNGEFHLDHCGALMDVEPMGEEFVHTMCHDIEDPTFEATATATNRRARLAPLHRPPRQPADRTPHCAWTIRIDPAAEPIPTAEITARVAGGVVAATPLAGIAGASPHGAGPGSGDGLRRDYAGPLVDRIATEEFGAETLRAVIEEVCIQQHLLAEAFMLAVEQRHGEAAARALGEHQFVGSAGISAHRLGRALGELGITGPADPDRDTDRDTDLLDELGAVLSLHPALRPHSLVDAVVEVRPDEVRVALRDCPGTAAASRLNWPALLRDGCDRPLQAIATAIDPRLVVSIDPVGEGELLAWSIAVGSAELAEQPEVELARFSTGTDFELPRPRPTSVVLQNR